jgi:hypothetical protein
MAKDILESVIETQYLDNGNYDVFVKLPAPYDGGPNSLLVESINGANAFLIENGQMHTPELTITAHVTKQQDSLLRHLYVATVRPGYIDQRYPIRVEWGDVSAMPFARPASDTDGLLNDSGLDSHDFYLAAYTPPNNVTFAAATLLPVSMVLRLI